MQLGPTVSEQLTAGSDLDRAAVQGPAPMYGPFEASDAGGPVTPAGSNLDVSITGAPWPNIIDGGLKFFIRGRMGLSQFREVAHRNVPGNYGMISSLANFGFRGSWAESDTGSRGIGLYPGPVPAATRPMWNNMLGIVWGLRDLDPNQQAQPGDLVNYEQIMVAPMEYTAPGNASLTPQLL